MADRVTVSNSSASSNPDYTVLTDEVVDGSIGTGQVAYAKIMDGTVNGTDKLMVTSRNAAKVELIPAPASGLSLFRSLDLDETEEDVKTSFGQVYGYYFANISTGWRYLKFYNATAANVTVGTTTPVLTCPLPPQSVANVTFPIGIVFSTAITAAATTGVADADTGAPAANDVVVNIFYS